MSSTITPLRFTLTSLLTVSIPTTIWYYTAQTSRSSHHSSLLETSLPPNVVTVSDMYVDSALPGDVLAFKRRWHRCAASPLAAAACVAQQKPFKKGEEEHYDHFGIIIPGETAYSPVRVLEATPSEGVRVMDLDDRLRYSRSEAI
eukprot:CAMPEP_0197546610 /NCGR_PEP_ID=MMETSP1320-20131121/1157_1 /TAXON_ID=91990 /ORGANISM="Bolidomonas sp., Strain RCC2347" /LENGTH=144 /DNA_ID=CAMNT_0043106193 /DNA_START=101 /DNA_END=532 /DNA_ORIENTATION=-